MMNYTVVEEKATLHYLYEILGKAPVIDRTAYVFKCAVVMGNVTLKEDASIFPYATVRGDFHPIVIGKYSSLGASCCLHSGNLACTVGDYVLVEPSVLLHCCTVEDYCFVGAGATVLDGAVIGKGSVVAAGALIPKNKIIPPFSYVEGAPAKVTAQLGAEQIEKMAALTKAHYEQKISKYKFI